MRRFATLLAILLLLLPGSLGATPACTGADCGCGCPEEQQDLPALTGECCCEVEAPAPEPPATPTGERLNQPSSVQLPQAAVVPEETGLVAQNPVVPVPAPCEPRSRTGPTWLGIFTGVFLC